MKFDYNEEQRLLSDSVRRFIAQDYGFEARRGIVASKEGMSAKVWSTLAELGLLGLPFSSDDGGFGPVRNLFQNESRLGHVVSDPLSNACETKSGRRPTSLPARFPPTQPAS